MAIRLYKRTLVFLFGLSAVLLGHATIARAQRFTVFDAPNTNYTQIAKINDRGDVIGILIDSTQSNKVRGFVRDAKGSFTVFDATPQATDTEPVDINARGDAAGPFVEAQANKIRAFVRDKNGNTTVFDAPNASVTFSSGINARGDVAGKFADAWFRDHSFVRDPKGNIVAFDAPNGVPVSGFGPVINARGDIAGSFYDESQGARQRGYVRDWNGNFTIFDTPENTFPWVSGINAGGDVAAFLVDQRQGGQVRGFVRDKNGILRSSMCLTRRVRL